MLKGFRDFVLRGNVMDLAIAVIIGAAFTGVVTSLVNDVLKQFIAAMVGKPDFSYVVFKLHGADIRIGNFLTALLQFAIVAAVVYFFVVLPLNKMMARFKGPVVPTTKPCPECLSEIPLAAKRCAHCGEPVPLTPAI